MNTTTGPDPAVSAVHGRFYKIITRVATGLGLYLIIVGLILTRPAAKAERPVSVTDTKFMLAATQDSMTDVKLGELAAQKSKNDAVKEYGQMMIKDHGIINTGLKALAMQKGVILSTGLDAKHQALVDKLSALPGSEFDDTYVIDVINAHQQDAGLFRAESEATRDADIKGFIHESNPVVGAHLKQMQGLENNAAVTASL